MSENPYQSPDEVLESGRQHQKTPPAAPAGGPLAFVGVIVLFLFITGTLIVAGLLITLLIKPAIFQFDA